MKIRLFIISTMISLFLFFYLLIDMPFTDSLIPAAFVGSCILLMREWDIEDDRKHNSERRDD
ncbi:hypothetical protein [Oceanospirillum sediminis]|uniref:Uncharacterized protein n=1 Tax=Oceanospirillum sediminis TaxID=2760088 RepID=A0A839IWJ9_9GAMM|nr:hypothetical protein [Oceanospirillum sediminis]MBB1489070.1 hypothetical protein [Oceanospirillum sediminis]